jgi:hypothetical protein
MVGTTAERTRARTANATAETIPSIVGKGAKHRAAWKCADASNIDPVELAKNYGHQAGMVLNQITSHKSQGIRLNGFWVQCPLGYGKRELDDCLACCSSKAKADIIACRMRAYRSE